ncbi:MAG: CHAT domain-containing protein [Fimbriimonadaceae bacterium]|nr:CHAT domain-containing protein [Fimbriimonadaceae bacterium]
MNVPRRRLLLGLGLLLLPLAAAPDWDGLVATCRAALQAGDGPALTQAAAKLQAAAEAAKERGYLGAAWLFRGEACYLQEDWAGAVTAYTRMGALCEELGDQDQLGYAWLCVGLSQRALGEVDAAVEAFDRAQAASRTAKSWDQAGRAAFQASRLLADRYRLAEARDRAIAATELFRKGDSPDELIETIFHLASLEGGLGQTGDCRERYEEALRLARLSENKLLIGRGLNLLGAQLYSDGDLERAEKLLSEGVDLLDPDDAPPLFVAIVGNLAQVYQAGGAKEEAEQLFRQAILCAGKFDLPDEQATQQVLLAICLSEGGHYTEALDLLDQAEAVRRRLGDPVALAMVAVNRANVQLDLGDLRGALALYLQSLEVLEPAGLAELTGTLYNNIGRVFDMQGDSQRAVEWYQKAGDVAQRAGKPNLHALALNNAALSIYNTLRPVLPLDDADTPENRDLRELLQQAHDMFKTSAEVFEGTGDVRYLATIYNNLGLLATELGQTAEGLKHLQQSLELHQQQGQRQGMAQSYANLGLLHLRAGRPQEALSPLREAIRLCQRLGELEAQAAAWLNVGEAEQALGHVEESLAAYYQSIDLTEQRRARVGGDADQQRQFLAANLHPYLILLEALLRARRPAEAFAVAERARGRALLDMIAGGRVDLRQRLPAEVAAALREREEAVATTNLKLARLAAQPAAGEAALQAAREALDSARAALRNEEVRLAGMYPDAAADGVTASGDLASTASHLPADTALLQYAVSSEQLVLFVVTNRAGEPHLETWPVATGEPALDAQVTSFRALCANPRRRWKDAAAALYERLLQPALAALPETITRLVIIPDDVLYECPFQALYDAARQQTVTDRYEVVYATSASLLAATLQLGDQRRADPAPRRMLLVADPDFGERTQDDRSSVAVELLPPVVRGARLAALPGTREEAAKIREVMGQATLLEGKEAQETAVRAAMPEYRYLHFATHGLLDPAEPLYSAIALAEPADQRDDGFIEAREITRQTLHAELVTLSACQTGRGKTEFGEGLIGLPWAFFVARVPAQVVSLWSVDDQMTKELMTRFYERLAAGRPTAAALREAALDLRRTGASLPGGRQQSAEHPYFWAPFQLIGDWR